METDDPAPTIESLLRHGEWARSVALRLVSDESAAEDIVQDSWLAAIKSPPRHAGQLRGWLGRVLSNRARETGRTDAHRREREERAARPEAQSSFEDLAQRAATQREVVGHVLDLDEPFRSVVLLRFFEDNSPPEIAERMGIPLKTVHSRLQRAFEKLRSKLDGEYGGREAWCIAYMPVASLAQPITPPFGVELATGTSTTTTIAATSAGAWIMGTNAKIALAAAILLGGAWGLYEQGFMGQGGPPITPREGAVVAASPEASKLKPEPPELATPPSNRRQSAASPEAEEAIEKEAPPQGLLTVRGRVIDVEGGPVPYVSVKARGVDQQGTAQTAADGSFEVKYLPATPAGLLVAAGTSYLSVQSPGWTTLRESSATEDNLDADHIVVAARTFAAEGWVRDIHGSPIDGARLSLSPQSRAFFGFDYVLDKTLPVSLRATTEPSGRFYIEAFPSCAGLRVTVFAEGFLAETLDMDDVEWPLQVELQRPEDQDTPLIEGIVLDDRGLAIAGARVKLATNETTSGADGRFRLQLMSTWVMDKTPLCASHAGHQSALLLDYGTLLKAQLPTPAPVELHLGPEALTVRGRVLDADGIPWPGWSVQIVDATEISQQRVPIVSAEIMSGMSKRAIRTSKDGSFQIDGLYDRSYVIRVYDPETLRVVQAQVRAGDLEAVVQVERVTPVLFQGCLLDSRDEPLVGVRATLSMTTESIGTGFSSLAGQSTLSDEDGLFELEYVPSESMFVSYSGDQIIPDRVALPAGALGEVHLIHISRRCHFRIELTSNWKGADEAQILDEEGEALWVHRYQANASSSFRKLTLRDGASEPLATSGAAHTLILFQEGVEVHRAPVQLTGDGVQVLRL